MSDFVPVRKVEDDVGGVLKFELDTSKPGWDKEGIDAINKMRGGIPEEEEFIPVRQVGGTMQPKPSPVPGGGSPISTITGKPETEYVPGEAPGASFGAMLKASFVDEPAEKIARYAESRGISPDQYKLDSKGNIIFKNQAGKWQREVGDLGITKLKELAASTTAHPGTYLSALGASLGPYGAVAGAGVGELARQSIGAYLYGGHKDPTKNLLNLGLETSFALLGEAAGKAINSAWGSVKRRGVVNTMRGKANPLTTFGTPDEMGMGILTQQEHAQAAMIKALAERHGITLAPHQMYDKAGMRDVWSYLRKHPATADSIQSFEKNLKGQTEEAIEKFIGDIGGYDLTSSAVGGKTKPLAEKAIKKLEDRRGAVVAPLYEKAFQQADEAGGVDISRAIGALDSAIEGTPDIPARKELQRVRKSLGTEESQITPDGKTEKIFNAETDLRKIQESIVVLNDLIEGTSQEAAQVSPSSKKILNRKLEIIKKGLLEEIQKVAPAFGVANQTYERLTNPVKKLKESIIGEITRIRSEKGLAQVPTKLLSPTGPNMPDAELLKQARQSLQPQDPKLWDQLIGSYIRDVYEGAKLTEQGEVKNLAGKMYKALAGKKQREILNAALGPEKAKTFNDLMEVFQRAAIGIGRESSETWMFGKIDQGMARGMGSKMYQLGSETKSTLARWTFGAWDEAILRGKLLDYFEALTAKDAQAQMKKIKAMTPGSRRMVEAMAVFTSGVLGTTYGDPEVVPDSSLPTQGRQRPPQMPSQGGPSR